MFPNFLYNILWPSFIFVYMIVFKDPNSVPDINYPIIFPWP